MNEPLRIFLADDHTLFLAGLRMLVSSLPDCTVVGEASTGSEAVEGVLALQPDIVLMDLQLPDLNGVEATRRILRASPHVGVIIVTMFEDDESVFLAMRAGARGYVLKGADRDELQRAILAVANGAALFSSSIADRLIRFFAQPRTAFPIEAFPELTEREREVLGLIAQGLPNGRISRQLDIRPKTVRNHITNIFSKLQVADRAEAMARVRAADGDPADGDATESGSADEGARTEQALADRPEWR